MKNVTIAYTQNLHHTCIQGLVIADAWLLDCATSFWLLGAVETVQREVEKDRNIHAMHILRVKFWGCRQDLVVSWGVQKILHLVYDLKFHTMDMYAIVFLLTYVRLSEEPPLHPKFAEVMHPVMTKTHVQFNVCALYGCMLSAVTSLDVTYIHKLDKV